MLISLWHHARGLKYLIKSEKVDGRASPLDAGRGLKLRNADFLGQLHRSCPARARGLKRVKLFHAVNGELVAPRGGAWIETTLRGMITVRAAVAPRVW